MHPVIFELGRIKLHSYGLMVFLAFVCGVWLGTLRARKAGIPTGKVMDLTMWILVSSLIGARLTYVLTHLNEFRGRWIDVVSPFQSNGTIGIAGLVILGGVVAAIPVSWWYLKRQNVPFAKMADVMVPGLAFGIAIGRVGCLLNGCCFGLPTDLPWGIVFPATCYAGAVFPHQHIHPTQVYEILANVLIGAILLLRTPHKRFDGELFWLFFLLYGLFRAWVETVRYYNDNMILFQTAAFHFTLSMLISILLALSGLYMLIREWSSGRSSIGKR